MDDVLTYFDTLMNGPFPAGEWSDIKNKIFRNQTRKHLGCFKKVLANLGYQGDGKVVTKIDSCNAMHLYRKGCPWD